MCSRPRPPKNCPPVALKLSVGQSVIGTLLGRQEATGPVLEIENTRIGNFGCSQFSKIDVLVFFRGLIFALLKSSERSIVSRLTLLRASFLIFHSPVSAEAEDLILH